MTFDYDLFVIGGGSGGVRAARIAAGEYGAKVGIAEASRMGGTCVIRGCVPKKLMIFAASAPALAEEARGYGWQGADAGRFDWPTFRASLEAELTRLENAYRSGLDGAGAARVVAEHLAGEVSLEHYRGSGMHTSASQAAVAELLRRHGSRRLADVRVTGVHTVSAGVWDIDLAGQGDLPPATTLTVERHWRTPERLTCSGLQPTTAAEYAVRA